MNRKKIAQETVDIQQRGFYEHGGRKIEIAEAQQRSEKGSRLITPEQGAVLVRNLPVSPGGDSAHYAVANEATVKATSQLAVSATDKIGVLNFASAKNPGGGFLNGAMAQEESLAASSGLYGTLLRNQGYYEANRACSSMMYTDHAIYSPDVVFFRDEKFQLAETPFRASVLTLPAVNFGQVLLKGEDPAQAEVAMKNRMRLALAIFADMGDQRLVLGAFGCGVFRNDPWKVAGWWRELLLDEGLVGLFKEIKFAVLDAPEGKCIRAFQQILG
ncbi:TIGR02452 family protein [Paenibacillus sp. PAMC21692]|uniref:TIGR02452 family protein n=1 Tax=Paenibacillus sp. PAMC21692 TaxID=2762320 RepID=UPI00164DC97E|nr:TIGR02452 family protein [Paenibacillus sp. PAMC21692]QNK57835.1 TIGR02452 family protein [Paenibacillus sp. PAMC21692]